MDTMRKLLGHSSAHTPITIQYMSDLHLEISKEYTDFEFPKTARFLLLAGDIGRFTQFEKLEVFLSHQCCRFDQVFYVLGNHEFYGFTHDDGLSKASALEQSQLMYGKLKILNRERVDLSESVTLLGCTLQSHILEDSRTIIEHKISDFSKILEWTADTHNQEHVRDLAWIEEQLREIQRHEPHRSVVMATHHAPVIEGSSNPEHQQNEWSSAFSTDVLPSLQASIGQKSITYWIFGHTHWCAELKAGQTKVLSNQRGYVFKPVGDPIPPTARSSLRKYQFWKKPEKLEFDPTRYLSIA
ncbi:MAG: hypothetical protein M1831_001310 [Alyxoria varia]|nr:MAG: hypothetical protein M1831_001310 [Alyxoria varia]